MALFDQTFRTTGNTAFTYEDLQRLSKYIPPDLAEKIYRGLSTEDEKTALPAGIDASNKLIATDNALILTADQVAAMPAGISASNKLVAANNAVLPTADQKASFPTGASGANKLALDADVDQNTADIATNTADITTNTSDIATHETRIDTLDARATAAITAVGVDYHAIIETPGGATANTDLAAIPAGTWQVLDVMVMLKGLGTTGDLVKLQKLAPGPTATDIANDMDINVADKSIVRPTTLDDAEIQLVGGTDTLRVVETDGGSSDSPAVRVIVRLAKVA